MKTIHLNKIDSTQKYLKDNLQKLLKEDDHILVHCDNQFAGRGRSSNIWEHFKNSLAFSFTLTPCAVSTLSSLELAVLTSNFFKQRFDKDIFLKWPNDLINENNQKCAGILIEIVNEILICGIGINLTIEKPKFEYNTQAGSIDLDQCDVKKMPIDIYDYILKNRVKPKELISLWNHKCVHLNQFVSVTDQNSEISGLFKGIGEFGQALIEKDNKLVEVYTGSLKIH